MRKTRNQVIPEAFYIVWSRVTCLNPNEKQREKATLFSKFKKGNLF